MALAAAVIATKIGLLTEIAEMEAIAGLSITKEDHDAYHAGLVLNQNETKILQRHGSSSPHYPPRNFSTFEHPHCPYMVPVFDQLHDPTSRVVGFVMAIIPWDRYMVNLLPEG